MSACILTGQDFSHSVHSYKSGNRCGHDPANPKLTLKKPAAMLRPTQYLFWSLVWVGFFYNFGLWLDKFMFWFYLPTSQPIIGPLRASLIYDIPVFLAYLSIIPGMAVFLVKS